MEKDFALDLIKKRRSVFPKLYSTKKVDDQIIEEMLEAARWAPTHKLTEPWKFIVFTDDGLKKLADFQAELYKKISTVKGEYIEANYAKLKTKPLKCSHIIGIGMVRDKKKSIPEVEEISAVACAVQNMSLVAANHGIGCYWGTGGVTYYDESKTFFGLGKDDRFLGFLFVGHLDGEWPKPGRRRPLEEKVFWVRNA